MAGMTFLRLGIHGHWIADADGFHLLDISQYVRVFTENSKPHVVMTQPVQQGQRGNVADFARGKSGASLAS